MFKQHYSRFLSQLQDQLHFAAHSHHFWPDVTRQAHLQYWDESARWIDDKWEKLFQTVIPKSQQHIARILNLRFPNQIVFAPNTHELVIRLLSTFPNDRPIRILSTNHEFHSFRRQIQRMQEAGQVDTKLLDSDLLVSDRNRFLQELKQDLSGGNFDLLFLSQVFFDSGLVLTVDDFNDLVSCAPKETVIAIDGYHSFGAIPVDLSSLEGRVFFLGGGYKYAQAGEGACFLVVPKGNWRPVNTGWFAEMDSLSSEKNGKTPYSPDGGAFWGSTFDPSGLYRFNSAWDLFEQNGITVDKIHLHVKTLQQAFLDQWADTSLSSFRLINLHDPRGHFLTFDLGTTEACKNFYDSLRKKGIWTDFRGSRLRLGFGMYQDLQDVSELIRRLKD